MVHGHLIAMVFCFDTEGCHATCSYRGVAPIVAHEERFLVKTCMLASRTCKHQNELARIPFVPVYIVKGDLSVDQAVPEKKEP